jgi:hypothetical protein
MLSKEFASDLYPHFVDEFKRGRLQVVAGNQMGHVGHDGFFPAGACWMFEVCRWERGDHRQLCFSRVAIRQLASRTEVARPGKSILKKCGKQIVSFQNR